MWFAMELQHLLDNLGTSLGALLLTVILYAISKGLYNVYFHPLAKFPGPKLFAASHLALSYYIATGQFVHKNKDLHDKYGDIVRCAPDEISFGTPAAIRDIAEKPGLPKNPRFYIQTPGATSGILSVMSNADHSRYRRLLSHAFSEKALRDQEPLMNAYFDQLISRLKERAGSPQDMVQWFNFVTFDIIGDLTLGESFDCLRQSELHPWVSLLYKFLKMSTFNNIVVRFPWLSKVLLPLILPKSLKEDRLKHLLYTKERVISRMDRDTDRPDFMSNVLKHNEKETGMTQAEIIPTFAILLVAGSETTATLLSAVTYYLLITPDVMAKVVGEIRDAFKTEDEITIVAVNKLKYQLAVLDEAMRIHPPAPFGTARITPAGGAKVAGSWIPENVSVYTTNYTMGHRKELWKDPESFVPERWLGDEKYADDKRDSSAPFSLGPRNCIGRNLAYAEMRVILARILWNFDLKLDDRSRNWNEMKVYALWEKPPLYVHMTPVERI